MYFNKMLSTFSLAALSLGPINSLPVYALDPLSSSVLCSMEEEEAPSCVSGILSQHLSGEDSKEELSHGPIVEESPTIRGLYDRLIRDNIAEFLSPQDRRNLAETCSVFSNDKRNSRVKKNFSFSMKRMKEEDADKFDLFLQRYSACKDLKISDLNWNFLSASLKRIKALKPDFGFPALKTLDLENNGITTRMLQEMDQTFFSIMPQLKTLNLGWNCIGSIGAQHLAESIYMQNLTLLDLSCNQIGSDGVQHLAASEYIQKLTSLILMNNNISAIGAQHLAGSPHMQNLTLLDLGNTLLDYLGNNNVIGDIGAQHLAESPYMQNLTLLHLSGNKIGDIGVQYLVASPHMRNLINLFINHPLTYLFTSS